MEPSHPGDGVEELWEVQCWERWPGAKEKPSHGVWRGTLRQFIRAISSCGIYKWWARFSVGTSGNPGRGLIIRGQALIFWKLCPFKMSQAGQPKNEGSQTTNHHGKSCLFFWGPEHSDVPLTLMGLVSAQHVWQIKPVSIYNLSSRRKYKCWVCFHMWASLGTFWKN